jgi:hypothetical protein
LKLQKHAEISNIMPQVQNPPGCFKLRPPARPGVTDD